MTATPLTPVIGRAERTLQALLKHQLDRAGLTFPQWTMLVFLDGVTALPNSELQLLPKVGHFLQEDAPEEVAVRIMRFLAK